VYQCLAGSGKAAHSSPQTHSPPGCLEVRGYSRGWMLEQHKLLIPFLEKAYVTVRERCNLKVSSKRDKRFLGLWMQNVGKLSTGVKYRCSSRALP
jgi:hypothetical protein